MNLSKRLLAAVATIVVLGGVVAFLAFAPLHRVYDEAECRAAYARARTFTDTAHVDLHRFAAPAGSPNRRCGELRGVPADSQLTGRQGAGEPPPPSVLAEARRELEARERADQEVREGFGVGGRLDSAQIVAMGRVDSANTAWLKTYVARWGWPTATQVGKEAVNAAFLIVQHATHDTAFMRAMLPYITESHRRGDLDGGAVAMLTDRVEVKAGRPQIYGTQLSLQNGRWVLDPIADSSHVDERRRSMGLQPLADYLRLVDSALKAP